MCCRRELRIPNDTFRLPTCPRTGTRAELTYRTAGTRARYPCRHARRSECKLGPIMSRERRYHGRDPASLASASGTMAKEKWGGAFEFEAGFR